MRKPALSALFLLALPSLSAAQTAGPQKAALLSQTSSKCSSLLLPPPSRVGRALRRLLFGAWDESVSERRIRIDDGEGGALDFHAIEKSPGIGQPSRGLVLLLHGFPEASFAYERELMELGKTHHVVALDLKGFSPSSRPRGVESYSLARLASEIKAVIHALGHEKAALIVGHDWGGVLAWAVAMAYPEALGGLVVLNAPHPLLFAREYGDPKSDQRGKSRYVDRIISPKFIDKLRFFKEAGEGQSLFASGFYAGRRKFRLFHRWMSMRTMMHYYRANFPPDEEKLLEGLRADGKVSVPTAVFWGEEDSAFSPRVLDGLADYVPDLTLVRLPASHWVNHEIADMPARIGGFLNALESRPAFTAAMPRI